MAAILKANDEVLTIEPKNKKDFKLDELQKAVGGYIEIISLAPTSRALLVLNEEGKLENLPINRTATMLAHQFGVIPPTDCIVGDVVICRDNEVK